MSLSVNSRRACFRILSLTLIVGAAMLYVRPQTRQMATPYLLQAILFLIIFGDYLPAPSRRWRILPCLPALIYHAGRLIGFWKTGAWGNLYFFEIALLTLTYLAAAVLIQCRYRPAQFRLAVLLLFAVCVGFGVWDILDGWWVLTNHTWTPIGERLSLFAFYYIPDTLFWILPFLMLGRIVWDRK